MHHFEVFSCDSSFLLSGLTGISIKYPHKSAACIKQVKVFKACRFTGLQEQVRFLRKFTFPSLCHSIIFRRSRSFYFCEAQTFYHFTVIYDILWYFSHFVSNIFFILLAREIKNIRMQNKRCVFFSKTSTQDAGSKPARHFFWLEDVFFVEVLFGYHKTYGLRCKYPSILWLLCNEHLESSPWQQQKKQIMASNL